MDIMVITEGEPGVGKIRKLEPVDEVTVIADIDAMFEELFVMDKNDGKDQKS